MELMIWRESEPLDVSRRSSSTLIKVLINSQIHKCSHNVFLCGRELIVLPWYSSYIGVTFTESWNTNCELDTELAYEPSAIEGLKLTLSSSFLPSSGYVS